jgi:hypothetical protein
MLGLQQASFAGGPGKRSDPSLLMLRLPYVKVCIVNRQVKGQSHQLWNEGNVIIGFGLISWIWFGYNVFSLLE